MRVLFVLPMIMASRAVAVTVAAEDKETHNVGCEAQAPHDQNQPCLLDLGRVDESGDGLEDDADTEGDEEYGVEEGT